MLIFIFHISFQKLIFEIEGRRNYLNDISKRRIKILEKMDTKAEHLRKHMEEITDS